MGLAARALAVVVASGSLAACAAIAGLDSLQENACGPDCPDGMAADVAPRSDSGGRITPETGGGVGAEAVGPGDAYGSLDAATDTTANRPDAVGGPDAVGADGPAVDAGVLDAAVPDAVASKDAEQDAHAEAGLDAHVEAEAADASDAGGCNGTVYFQDSFADNSKGWTLDTSWTIAEECMDPPLPQPPDAGYPDPTTDHTGTPGSGVVGAYVCGNNPTGATTSFRYATSPPMDTSAAGTVTLGFWRWLNSDRASYMVSTVDVYDGTAWDNIYTNFGSAKLVTDSAWTHEQYDVTPYGNSAFQVRFGYAIIDTRVYEMSGWNIDDVLVSSPSCP